MTLIVGILCKDGVVIAADSAATYGVPGGQQTISQLTKKITVIDNSVVVACSGAIGLSQRFVDEITKLWRAKTFSGGTAVAAGATIGLRLKDHIVPEMNVAQYARNVVGQSAISNATCLTITALPISKTPALIQFTEIGSPEVATSTLPFVTIGSGQVTADPFLAFLRALFWPDHEPRLPDGIFAALWTLQHAIANTPGGLAHPIEVAVLERQDSIWLARMLSKTELQEHEQNIKAAEQALVGFKTAKVSTEPPPLP